MASVAFMDRVASTTNQGARADTGVRLLDWLPLDASQSNRPSKQWRSRDHRFGIQVALENEASPCRTDRRPPRSWHIQNHGAKEKQAQTVGRVWFHLIPVDPPGSFPHPLKPTHRPRLLLNGLSDAATNISIIANPEMMRCRPGHTAGMSPVPAS